MNNLIGKEVIGNFGESWRICEGVIAGGDVCVIERKVDGEWSKTPGQWYVSTLMEDPLRDKIYIDYGAKWLVSGMREALANVPEDYNRFVSSFEKALASGA